MPQHVLRMVAGRMRLDDRGGAGSVQPGQQNRRFYLGRSHREGVADRDRRPRSDHRHRQPAAVAGDELRAHADQRRRDPRHRALHQRCVTGHECGQPVGGQNPGQQPCPGAAVAHVEHRGRFAESADTDTVDPPDAVLAPGRLGAQRVHRLGGAQHVLALQQSVDFGPPDRKRAQHQGAVRDRLVAGHANRARQSTGLARRQRLHRSISVTALAVADGALMCTATAITQVIGPRKPKHIAAGMCFWL